MRTGVRLAGAVVALVAAVPQAAGARVACHVVNDRIGDATPAAGTPADSPLGNVQPNDPSLDIRTADVASSTYYLTTTVRLAGWSTVDPYSPLGRQYVFYLKPAGYSRRLYTLATVRPFDVPRAEWGVLDPLFGPIAVGVARVTVVPRTAEVQVTFRIDSAPFAASVLGPGQPLSLLQAQSLRLLGDPTEAVTPSNLSPSAADDATSTTTYVAGTASCLRAGS